MNATNRRRHATTWASGALSGIGQRGVIIAKAAARTADDREPLLTADAGPQPAEMR